MTLVAAQGAARADRVLCYGLDGHVDIEASFGGACADAGGMSPGERTQTAPHVNTQDASHCGPCEDVPLETRTVQNSAHRAHFDATPATAKVALVSARFFFDSPTLDIVATRRGGRVMPPSAVLRSVSLQC